MAANDMQALSKSYAKWRSTCIIIELFKRVVIGNLKGTFIGEFV